MALPKLSVPEHKLTIPSTQQEIRFRGFLVGEEKVLMLAVESENQSEILEAVRRIICNCTFSEIDVTTLTSFDLEYIFLQLRSKSKGEVIEVKHHCIKCEHENPLSININEVEVDFPKDHQKKIELQDGVGIVMKYPELDVAEKIKDNKDVDGMFDVINTCIDYIYTVDETYKPSDVSKKELDEFIDSMNDEQFNAIQLFFQTIPSLQIIVEYDCGNEECNNVEPVILEGLESFLG